MHRLTRVLLDAADGRFPPEDGVVEVVGPPPGPVDAVVAFTAHHVVSADVGRDEVLRQLPPGDLGAPMSARFLVWLADRLGSEPGTMHVVLAAAAKTAGGSELVERPDLAAHHRVARAERYRSEVRIYTGADERGIVALGRGLAGRVECSVEIDEEMRGAGIARTLVAAALSHAPAGEPVFAQVAPGNVASLRCFLAAGFRPLAAEVLFLRESRGRGAGTSS